MPGGKRAIRTSQRDLRRAAFVKQYEGGPDFTFPKDFDLSNHDLLLCESIRSGLNTAVLLYWNSEERAKAQEAVVEKLLGLTGSQPIGAVIEVVTHKMPNWLERPAQLGKLLVGAAALFGAFSVIQDHFAQLFYPPNVVVFASNAASQNYRLGEPIDIPLLVRNEARLGEANVRLASVALKPLALQGPVHSLQFNIAEIPQLQAGQNTEVHVSGLMPEADTRQAAPQKFVVQISAFANEGLLRFKRPVHYQPYTVSLWSNRSWDTQLVTLAPTVAQIQVELWAGVDHSNGVCGDVTWESAAKPAPGGIALSDADLVRFPIIVSTPTGSVGKVDFKTVALEPFNRYSYAVSIALDHAMTKQEWDNFRSSIRVMIVPRPTNDSTC